MKFTKRNKVAAQARNEELIVQDLTDEVLIYDLKNQKAHCLNVTAAFIWGHCDGQKTAEEIAKLMEAEWHTPVTEETVWFTLDKLSNADLLQEQISLPPSVARVSRRNAVRRLGLGALLAAPVVLSLVAPQAASAASIPTICTACRKKSDGACPAPCGTTVLGTCYDNSGCGNGQALYCSTCQACFSDPNLSGTISWRAPGSLC